MVLLCVLVVLLAGAVAALASGRVGTDMSVAMPPPVHTTGHELLTGDEITRADVAALRFDRAARGYRMDQVDAVLDRIAEQLDARDERIAVLTAHLEGQGQAWHTAPEPVPDRPDDPLSTPATPESTPGSPS
ncbi:hypothetical protein KEM60_02895 [Austwickia sp. TVS 96-490-7B]|uniref:DivIVA domain-containing protein n=1 Tax=Austwickia sp. TVS 96-490-7B TaxID=2830843 RepID=UPI001DB3B3B0|nr:DivIVA domain-containing protein [Austwickia sp. TVS 96-490-7B]MBW3086666.1 hypothetical protein [Austwickia sp. TVS 96-490-7B]